MSRQTPLGARALSASSLTERIRRPLAPVPTVRGANRPVAESMCTDGEALRWRQIMFVHQLKRRHCAPPACAGRTRTTARPCRSVIAGPTATPGLRSLLEEPCQHVTDMMLAPAVRCGVAHRTRQCRLAGGGVCLLLFQRQVRWIQGESTGAAKLCVTVFEDRALAAATGDVTASADETCFSAIVDKDLDSVGHGGVGVRRRGRTFLGSRSSSMSSPRESMRRSAAWARRSASPRMARTVA